MSRLSEDTAFSSRLPPWRAKPKLLESSLQDEEETHAEQGFGEGEVFVDEADLADTAEEQEAEEAA